MNINFRDDTYKRIRFLATENNQSMAAYISDLCDAHADAKVDTQYNVKSSNEGNGSTASLTSNLK